MQWRGTGIPKSIILRLFTKILLEYLTTMGGASICCRKHFIVEHDDISACCMKMSWKDRGGIPPPGPLLFAIRWATLMAWNIKYECCQCAHTNHHTRPGNFINNNKGEPYSITLSCKNERCAPPPSSRQHCMLAGPLPWTKYSIYKDTKP